jgi:sugar lactone lactonase YvrE
MEQPTEDHLATLATGLTFPESPRWHEGRVWVSDWGAHRVLAIDLDGRVEVVAQVESFPMCIDHLPDGRLLVVASAQRVILRQEADGTLVTHADLGGIAEFPWNDIVVEGRGNTYVNNIGFDFAAGDVKPGLVALVTPSGAARQVADGLLFPNGMAVTADNRTLIVAESYGQRLTAFDIGADGDLANRREWAPVEGPPDGICLDAEGAIWYADVPNRRCVRVYEGGEVAQTVNLDRGGFACALGGADRRTLFIATNVWTSSADMDLGTEKPGQGQVQSLRVAVPGVGWP